MHQGLPGPRTVKDAMKIPCIALLGALPILLQAQPLSTPLKAAARQGRLGDVQRLLSSGVEADQRDEGGNTPLISAAYHGHADVVRLLLKHGATPAFRNQEGYAALDYAMERGHRQVAQALLSHWRSVALARNNPGEADVLALLLQVCQPESAPRIVPGIDLNRPNASGYGPLAMAVRWGSLSWAKALIEAGADADAPSQSRYNATPLMEATRDGRVDLAQVLLAAGAQVNARDKHGDHALNWAAFFGHADLVQLLVERGSRLDYTGQSPENALQIATREGHARVVEILRRAAATSS